MFLVLVCAWEVAPCIDFPSLLLTWHIHHGSLNNINWLFYSSGVDKSSMILSGLKSRSGRELCSFSGDSRGGGPWAFFTLFYGLETVHVLGSSLKKPATLYLWPVFSGHFSPDSPAFRSTFKYPCDHIEPTQII